jgi:hypothetical protein
MATLVATLSISLIAMGMPTMMVQAQQQQQQAEKASGLFSRTTFIVIAGNFPNGTKTANVTLQVDSHPTIAATGKVIAGKVAIVTFFNIPTQRGDTFTVVVNGNSAPSGTIGRFDLVKVVLVDAGGTSIPIPTNQTAVLGEPAATTK